MNQEGKPKGWWFKWGGIWEAAESSKLLNLKFYAKSFPMESCRVGRKPWDVEVGEVEIWRLEKLRYGGWRSSRTQLTVEADPYTHHSPVSHTHPNWEHKYVTSPFSDPSKQSNKRHVCAFAVKCVYYCQEWTRLTWQWVHLLDQLPVELSKSIQIPSSPIMCNSKDTNLDLKKQQGCSPFWEKPTEAIIQNLANSVITCFPLFQISQKPLVGLQKL